MNKTIRLLALVVIFTVLIFLSQTGKLEAGKSRDLILVVDTSLTMVGLGGGQNILPLVKKSLPNFIDQLEEDDSVTFVTFDTNVKVTPTVYINDDNDKKIIKTFISTLEAKGKWTYTSLMLMDVLAKAQDLEEKDPDRQRVIVIMTDSLDDPPPGMSQDRLAVNKMDGVKKFSNDKSEWFILVMNFGDAKKNKALAKQLKKISKYSKVIDASKTDLTKKEKAQEAIDKSLKQNIQDMADKKEGIGSSINKILIAVIVVALLLLIIFFLKRLSSLKVYGRLEYWDHTVISPYQKIFDLTKQNLREVVIGKQGNLRISEIEISNPIVISAARDGGEVKNALTGGKGYDIEFVNRDPGRFLQAGDVFKVANYSFRYTVPDQV